jgi:outer membrane immunogenic protein
MKRLILLASAAVLAGPAMAADVVYSEPAPIGTSMPASVDWSGFYLGVQGGIGAGSTGVFSLDTNNDGVFGDAFAPFGDNFEGRFDSGFVGGVHAGYDWQFGSIVFGGIVDINYADIGDRQSGFSSTPAFYHIDRSIDWLATGRARVGYLATERLLVYGTGGLAYANVENDFVTNTPAAFTVSGGDEDRFGYTVGGGMETMVTERLSVGIEYLYTNLGSDDYNVRFTSGAFATDTPAGFADSRGSDRNFDFHTIQAKISYRF